MPTPQPSTTVSNRFFLMNSLMNEAHSITWISVFTPMVPRRCWMSSATFFRSSLPWFVRIVNENALPSLSRRTPSPLSFQPASARRAFAFAGS